MMTLEQLRAAARSLGFEAVAQAGIHPIPAPGVKVHPQAEGLVADPRDILPEARSVLMLVMPYQPFEPNPPEAEIDSYYITSNLAHENARRLAEWLNEQGVRAVMTSTLRVKPLAARAGLGRFGRNTLIAAGAYGTRVSLQTLVTDLPCDRADDEEGTLDERCLHCRACLAACPTGALRGDGTLDIERCVRAQPENAPLPESMRPLIGASLLGCDLCQRVCPRNAAVQTTVPKEPLQSALSLTRLLEGEYKAFIPLIGKNNARKMRLLNRAALAAANRHRRDLLPLLEKLTALPDPVSTHARWAIDQLKTAGAPQAPENESSLHGINFGKD